MNTNNRTNLRSIFRHRYFQDTDPVLLNRFAAYHQHNPSVLEDFADFARQMRSAGKQKYAAIAIISQIRWQHDLETTGDEFKINNDYAALYARMLMAIDPSFTGFFDLRAMKPVRPSLTRRALAA
jgi:hypothetical protein